MPDEPKPRKTAFDKHGFKTWTPPSETAALEAEIKRLYRQMQSDPTEKRLHRIRALISRELLRLLPLAVRGARRGKVALLRLILRYVR
jgi:hypothetical protein